MFHGRKMGFVKTLLINLVDPFGLLRKVVVQPALGTAALFGFYDARAASDDSCYGERTNASARDIAVKATFLAFATAVIIWMSIFMYIAFYYTYMPAIEHIRPVHIQFEWVCNKIPFVLVFMFFFFTVPAIPLPMQMSCLSAISHTPLCHSRVVSNCLWSASLTKCTFILKCPSHQSIRNLVCSWYALICEMSPPNY